VPEPLPGIYRAEESLLVRGGGGGSLLLGLQRRRGGASSSEEEMAAAGNEWINGYLEAILDAGARRRGERGAPALTTPRLLQAPALAEAAAYSPARYFVEEVVSRFDDRDLHRTWTKVTQQRVVTTG